MGQSAAAANVVNAHYRSFIAGRWNDYDRQLDPEVWAHLPTFPSPIEGVKRYAMQFHASVHNPRCHLEDFESYDGTVVATARLWGQLVNPALGPHRVGEVFVFTCRSLFTVKNHRIITCDTLVDKPRELTALGLAFLP